MKKGLLAAVILVLSSAMAMAGGVGVYGTSMDMEDFDDRGVGGGLKFQGDFGGNENLGLEVRLGGVTDYGHDDSWLAMVEANLTLCIPLADTIKGYVGGGVGYYIFPEYDVKIGGVKFEIDPEDDFGFFAVGGVELSLSADVALFAEAKYLNAEVDKFSVDGEDFDISDGDFGGLGFNAGLLFRY